MAEAARQQRNRKDNFTHAEIVALIQAYGQRKELLQGRFKSTLSNRDKKKGWDAVAAEVNALSTTLRSVEDLKKKWRKLASEARADLARRKSPGTRGGPRHKEGVYTDLIADIFGDQSALSGGVQGGIDVGDNGLFAVGTELDDEGFLKIC